MPFEAKRETALRQLINFIPRAGHHYGQNRNFDEGPKDRQNVSSLSAFIRKRLISEAEILHQVFEAYSFSAAEKFIQEVLWRTYWKGWLEMRPQVWASYLQACDQLQGIKDQIPYKQAVSGNTKIECFDFWVRELMNTGYLHNHARMWFASIWIYALNLPWQLGAEFFYRHLLDGDPASNTLSWRWVAGLQTRGKRYIASAKNIEKFSTFKNVKLPALNDREILEDIELNPSSLIISTPRKIPDEAQTLLIHSEDLSPELSELRDFKHKRIVSVSLRGLGLSDHFDSKVLDFDEEALKDAAQRAQNAFGLHVDHLSSLDELGKEPCLCLGVALGPVQERLKALPNIHFVWRKWDQELYPMARAGFFNFKKKLERYDIQGLCADSINWPRK